MSHPIERACPKCGAQIGERCSYKRGGERKAFHRERGSRRAFDVVITGKATDSPIELLLVSSIESWIDHHDIPGVSISTQVPIGPYRADIVVEEGGRCLVVECDGAKFHNTAERVAHDKRRDRFCASQGIAVMRFTGREITRDMRGCAAEIGAWIRRRQ